MSGKFVCLQLWQQQLIDAIKYEKFGYGSLKIVMLQKIQMHMWSSVVLEKSTTGAHVLVQHKAARSCLCLGDDTFTTKTIKSLNTALST